MSFKLIGLSLVFCSGVYTAFVVKRGFDTRVENLSSFLTDFDFYINSVSCKKTKAGEITREILSFKKGIIKDFYINIYEYFEKCNESYINSAFKTELNLKKEDKAVIGDFFKSLGQTDYQSQIKELEFNKNRLIEYLEEAKESRAKNQKSGTMLVMSVFLILIIFLV